MDADQQFCLKWNNYHVNLQTVFAKLYTLEALVDVTLACEGRKLKCHKLVLSACSSYFEDLILDNPCQHPIVVMKDVRFWELEALVKFMYHGEVNVSQDKLGGLLKVAEALKIKGLAETGSDDSDKSMTQGVPLSQPDDRLVRKLEDENVGFSRKRQKLFTVPDRHSISINSDLPSVAVDSKAAAEEDSTQKTIIDSSEKCDDVKNNINPVIKYESEDIIADDDSQTTPVFTPQFEGDSGDDFALEQSSASTSTQNQTGQAMTRLPMLTGWRRNYTRGQFNDALEAVVEGGMPVRRAERIYGVPEATLRMWKKKLIKGIK